jgi:hypothetical protein
MHTVAVLGAGFSHAAGLPLTSQLLEGKLPLTASERDRARMQSVRTAFDAWSAANPGQPTEAWLRTAYDQRGALGALVHAGADWENIVQYILRRLSCPTNAGKGRYYYGVTRYQADVLHRQFWDALLSNEGPRDQTLAVVTLNYDILPERALLRREPPAKYVPLFYYGGFQYNQIVHKMIDVSAPGEKKYVIVHLGHDVPLYKLHGSINWAWEPHTQTLKIHDDVRAAFRSGDRGVAAIIPPVAEQEMPAKFARIWTEAEEALGRAERWIVCGYSMPTYDLAVRDLLERSAALGPKKIVVLIDPMGSKLAPRWMFNNVAAVEQHRSITEALTSIRPPQYVLF